MLRLLRFRILLAVRCCVIMQFVCEKTAIIAFKVFRRWFRLRSLKSCIFSMFEKFRPVASLPASEKRVTQDGCYGSLQNFPRESFQHPWEISLEPVFSHFHAWVLLIWGGLFRLAYRAWLWIPFLNRLQELFSLRQSSGGMVSGRYSAQIAFFFRRGSVLPDSSFKLRWSHAECRPIPFFSRRVLANPPRLRSSFVSCRPKGGNFDFCTSHSSEFTLNVGLSRFSDALFLP